MTSRSTSAPLDAPTSRSVETLSDWGARAWETDEAADWFHRFWRSSDISMVVEAIERFDQTLDRYESGRAAAHVLQSFGSPYMWPAASLEQLPSLLDRAVQILTCMIEPPDASRGFLDLWCHDEAVIHAVKDQIRLLKQRRSEIVAR